MVIKRESKPLRRLTDAEIVVGDTVPDSFILGEVDPDFDFFPEDLQAREVDVTPALATKFMNRNLSNRPIDQGQVDNLVAALVAGEWKRGVGDIAFDATGRMINGQHTCLAVIRTGLTAKVLVKTGLEPEAQHVMDTQKKRSAAGAMVITGEVDRAIAAKVEAVCRTAIARDEGFHRLVRNNVNGLRTPRNLEIMAYQRDNPDVLDAVLMARILRTTKPMRLQFLTPNALAYAYLILARIDQRQAEQFFRDLGEHKSSGNGDPITAVWDCYESWNANKNNGGMRMAGHLYILFSAWNARRERRKLNRIDPKPIRRGGRDVPKEVPDPR